MNILYEDDQIIVVEKPAGIESQSSRSFEPDMVSEVKKHINSLSPKKGEPYVGVIHRLDRPVPGIMVYAKFPGIRWRKSIWLLFVENLWKTLGRTWIICGKTGKIIFQKLWIRG